MKSPNLGFLSFSEADNPNLDFLSVSKADILKNDTGEGTYTQIDIVNDLICYKDIYYS